jgi:hypothetical protein
MSELTHRFLSDLEDAKERRDEPSKHISLYEPFQNFIEVIRDEKNNTPLDRSLG